jgi:hypothetical protein
VPGEAANSGSNPLYNEGCRDQWILHSTGIQILRASAAQREIDSVLRVTSNHLDANGNRYKMTDL